MRRLPIIGNIRPRGIPCAASGYSEECHIVSVASVELAESVNFVGERCDIGHENEREIAIYLDGLGDGENYQGHFEIIHNMDSRLEHQVEFKLPTEDKWVKNKINFTVPFNSGNQRADSPVALVKVRTIIIPPNLGQTAQLTVLFRHTKSDWQGENSYTESHLHPIGGLNVRLTGR